MRCGACAAVGLSLTRDIASCCSSLLSPLSAGALLAAGILCLPGPLLLGPHCSLTELLYCYCTAPLHQQMEYDELTYNGLGFSQFVVERTAGHIAQTDNHFGELTVRETFDFSALCQAQAGRARESARGGAGGGRELGRGGSAGSGRREFSLHTALLLKHHAQGILTTAPCRSDRCVPGGEGAGAGDQAGPRGGRLHACPGQGT